jgi:hypothetical protein
MLTWPNWSPPMYFRHTPGGHDSAPGSGRDTDIRGMDVRDRSTTDRSSTDRLDVTFRR